MRRLLTLLMAALASAALVGLSPVGPATAATGWTPPVTVSDGNRNGAGEGVQLAVGPNDLIAATWAHFENDHYSVQVSVSTDKGLTWSAPQTISSTNEHTEGPHVAINGSGAIMVAWGNQPDSLWFTQYSVSTNGGASWSPYATISDMTFSSETNSLVAVGEHGFSILMSQNDGSRADVVQRFSPDDGSTWSSFRTISNGSNTTYFFHQALDGQGNIGVTFMKLVGSQWEVQARTSSDNGFSWGVLTDLDPGAATADYPSIMGLAKGGFTVVWEYAPGPSLEILASTGNPDGSSWTTPVPAGFTSAGGAPQFTTALGPGDTIAVVWSMDDVSTRQLFSVLSHDGGLTWDMPSLVAEAPLGVDYPFYSPRVVFLSTGEIAIAWTHVRDRLSLTDNVYASMSDDGMRWSVPEDLSGPGGGQVALVATGSGDVVAGWRQVLDDQAANTPIQASTHLAPSLPDTGIAPWVGAVGMGALVLAGLGVVTVLIARRRLARS